MDQMQFTNITDRALKVTVGAAEICAWKLSSRELVLIDTGTVASPELLDLLSESNMEVRAIIQTHLHIDHIANNDALVQKYGAGVYACEPELPDAAFSGRTFDYPIITNREDEPILIDGQRFETVFTPGHTEGHQMIVTPDGLCCLGDVMMTLGRLKTAKIPFMRDVTQSLLSLERVRETDYPLYLAAHRGMVPKELLSKTVDANIEIELRLYELLKSLVTGPVLQPVLEERFMRAAGLTSPRVMAFRFMHITCDARIHELVNAGELHFEGEFVCPGPEASI